MRFRKVKLKPFGGSEHGRPDNIPGDSMTEDGEDDDENVRYYDDKGFCSAVFLTWVPYWIRKLKYSFMELSMLPSLPKADRISYWQPIFSKHISDGLLRMERQEAESMASPTKGRDTAAPYRGILFRAIVRTFWRRCLFLCFMTVVIKGCSLGIALLIKFLLEMMSNGKNIMDQVGMIFIILGVEIVHLLVDQHLVYYKIRTEIVMEAVLSISLFQHGLRHRKDYSNDIDGYNYMSGCKHAVHSCEPGTKSCSHNPLMCPARRHSNRELSSDMYTYLYYDTTNMAASLDACICFVKFISSFAFGAVITSTQIGVGILRASIVIGFMTATMVVVELSCGFVLKHLLHCRDTRLLKVADVIGHLHLLKTSGIDDIGYNNVCDSRNDEIASLKARCFLSFFNQAIIYSVKVAIELTVLLGFIKRVKKSVGKVSFDLTAPITLLFVMNKLARSMDQLPRTMRVFVETYTSYKRLSVFLSECSPNYYLSSNERAERYDTSSLKLEIESNDIMSSDTVVVYKGATMAWLDRREDVLHPAERKPAVLKEIDFELKRGDIKIITGSQGCGKSSFLKSILGEMSLVSGSMAVAPLSTGMPIFYTSQEVWLPSGSIRAIITFGYAYDEEVYREVVRCAELESDFNSWQHGDSRVITEKGYSLSGGQRVRISLARALYAYMIFSKANEDMEENRCCFLVCLDEPFNGLDPTVATAVFNNLFNKDTGLLVRNDVAVVMAMSRTTMDICYDSDVLDQLVDVLVYEIDGDNLTSGTSLWNHSSVSVDIVKVNPDPGSGVHLHPIVFNCLDTSPRDLFLKCEVSSFAQQYDSDTCLTNQQDVEIPKESVDEQNKITATLTGYATYIKFTGNILFASIVVILAVAVVLDRLLGVLVAKWSDFIKVLGDDGDSVVNTTEILRKHDQTAKEVTILGVVFVVLIFSGMFMAVFGNIRASKRIHKFIMNSLFQKHVGDMKVKESLAATMTFLSSDMYYIDEHVGRFIIATLFSLLSICVQFITICYSEPIISPIPVLLILILHNFFVKKYLLAAKKLQTVMLDANASINTVYGDVMSGSSIYRSFGREHLCMERVYRHSESFFRVKFLKIAFRVWIMLTCKLFNSIMLLAISFLPVAYSYVRGTELKTARLGLGISYSLGVNTLLTSLIYNLSSLENQMCSMVRFKHYFLQDKFSLNEKFESMGETILAGYGSPEERENAARKRVADLARRRKDEYRNFMFRRYRSVVTTLFYKPRIEVLDVASYLPAEHSTLTLDRVCVPQSDKSGPDTTRYILSDVSATTRAGDVIGIVGRTGAGKSTLLSVFRNIARKREGSVLLDGRELSSIPRSLIRHVIGVLPQFPFVFKGWTLRRFLDPRMLYSDDEIFDAIECCGLLDLVSSISGGKGLDVVLLPEDVAVNSGLYLLTPLIKLKSGPAVGGVMSSKSWESGTTSPTPMMCFSPSQLRMLSFARLVLYRSAYRIVFIDEPPSDNCSAINEETPLGSPHDGQCVRDVGIPIYDLVRLYFRHCTTFVVAHDRNALRACNVVWIMQNGSLVKQCSVGEFLSSGLPTSV